MNSTPDFSVVYFVNNFLFCLTFLCCVFFCFFFLISKSCWWLPRVYDQERQRHGAGSRSAASHARCLWPWISQHLKSVCSSCARKPCCPPWTPSFISCGQPVVLRAHTRLQRSGRCDLFQKKSEWLRRVLWGEGCWGLQPCWFWVFCSQTAFAALVQWRGLPRLSGQHRVRTRMSTLGPAAPAPTPLRARQVCCVFLKNYFVCSGS